MSNQIRSRRIVASGNPALYYLQSEGGGVSLVDASTDKIKSLVAGGTVTITDNGTTVTISSTGDDIIVVANYSALPAANTVSGHFYWCSASQGTSWLPGSLGGTYYNAGLYYSNGTTWEFMDVPYQATQATVDTGTNTNQFVTPATFTNASKWGNYAPLASPTFTGTATIPALTLNLTSTATGDLYYNSGSGVVGRLADVVAGSILISGGTSTAPAWSSSPTLTTSLTVPVLIGGTGTTSTLIIQPTSGVGTTGADIAFNVGNNGATQAMLIRNAGTVLIGTSASNTAAKLEIKGASNFNGLQIGNGTVGALFQVSSGNAGFVGFNGSAYNSLDIRCSINTQLFLSSSNNGVAIGHTSPNAVALLDCNGSSTKGVRFPNMTTTQKNAITGVTGLVVFDTTLNKLCVWGATTWETITSV